MKHKIAFIAIIIVLALMGLWVMAQASAVYPVEDANPINFQLNCRQNVIQPGSAIKFQTVIEPKIEGKTVPSNLTFSIMDPNGKIISTEEVPLQLTGGEKYTHEKEFILNQNALLGVYTVGATLYTGSIRVPAVCTIFVEDGISYYYKMLEEISAQVIVLENEIDALELSGTNAPEINNLRSQLGAIKKDLRNLQRSVISRNYGAFLSAGNLMYSKIAALESQISLENKISHTVLVGQTVGRMENIPLIGLLIAVIIIIGVVLFKPEFLVRPKTSAEMDRTIQLPKSKRFEHTGTQQAHKEKMRGTEQAFKKAYKLGAIKPETWERVHSELENEK